MVLKCIVKLLDGKDAYFEVDKAAKGAILLERVCQSINIEEKDYFGLICKGSDLQRQWLKLDKKIRKQGSKRERLEFDFALKFYPSDPSQLKEEITRYQVCLQLRQDLRNHLECSIDKFADLIAYWVISEYEGENITAECINQCLQDVSNSNEDVSSPEFADRVLSLCQADSDMSSAEADLHFLTTAASLRLYGVHFYVGKETAGTDILIGISSKGVTEKRKGQIPVLHSWSRIKNIVRKNNKFKVKLLRVSANGDPRLKKTFLFDSEEQVQQIWKSAVDHHIFFRVGDKGSKPTKRKGSILRRLSSRKKKPKTEVEVQEESKQIKRQPPNVTRGNSLRKSTSFGRRAPTDPSQETKPKSTAAIPDDDTQTTSVAQVDALPKPDTSQVVLDDPKTKDSVVESPQEKQDDCGYAEIGEALPEELNDIGREYREEDLADAVAGNDEGSATGGSSILLFTETIVEVEEEEDQHNIYAAPSPRKTNPFAYNLLRDDRKPSENLNESLNRITETDLDADIMLGPTGTDPPELADDVSSYTEEWEDLQVVSMHAPKKDVRFVTNEVSNDDQFEFESDKREELPSTVDGRENPAGLEETATSSDSDSRSISVETPPVPNDQVLSDEEMSTIKEYVPKAKTESSEDSDGEYDSESTDTYHSHNAAVEPLTESIFDRLRSNNIGKDDDQLLLSSNEDENENVPSVENRDEQKIPSNDNAGEKQDSTEDGSVDPKSLQSSPILSGKKESHYRNPRNLGIDFRVGDAYKPISSSKNPEKIIDGAASTTAATIGDEDDLALQELDEDILYDDRYSNEDDDAKVSDHSDDEPNRTTPHEVIFKSDKPSIPPVESLLKAEIESKVLHERTHDGAASTTAATIGDDDVLSMEELDDELLHDEDPDDKNAEADDEAPQDSVKLDSASEHSSLSDVSGNTDELLDIDALEKAWSLGAQLDEDDELFRILFRTPAWRRKPRNKSEIDLNEVRRGKEQAMAFQTDIEEEPASPRRREKLAPRPFIPSWPFNPMSVFDSILKDIEDPELAILQAAVSADDVLKTFGRDKENTSSNGMKLKPGDPPHESIREKVKTRSRSPSASPRMVGEEFIPGVPDFIHSVVPYQLTTPKDVNMETSPPSTTLLQRKPTHDNKSDDFQTTSTVDESKEKLASGVGPESIEKCNTFGAVQSGASSGRNTPTGSTSLSEGTSSSNSKSSVSSFPSFVHSVFPLRRTPSERRGRSKTRRKREKKIMKQKNKKVTRSKSREKKSIPSIEVTNAPNVEGFTAFPIVPPTTIYSLFPQNSDERGMNKSDDCRMYDQESLDKITLSDSDDAHSKLTAAEEG